MFWFIIYLFVANYFLNILYGWGILKENACKSLKKVMTLMLMFFLSTMFKVIAVESVFLQNESFSKFMSVFSLIHDIYIIRSYLPWTILFRVISHLQYFYAILGIVQTLCPEGLFRCGDGQCISQSFKCNKNKDCRDGSDESIALCGPVGKNQHELSPLFEWVISLYLEWLIYYHGSAFWLFCHTDTTDRLRSYVSSLYLC